MASISARLAGAGAHHDLVEWARSYGDDWSAFYTACPRADWLLALAARFDTERGALVAGAVACVRFASSYLAHDDATLELALRAAEGWAADGGDATACIAHAERFEALTSGDDAVSATVYQAAAAALRAPSDPRAASYAATCAVQAAVMAAGDCAMDSALRFSQQRCAELVRACLPMHRLIVASQRSI